MRAPGDPRKRIYPPLAPKRLWQAFWARLLAGFFDVAVTAVAIIGLLASLTLATVLLVCLFQVL